MALAPTRTAPVTPIPMTRFRAHRLVGAVLLAVAASAFGQSTDPFAPADPVRLDEGRGDVGPLSRSLRTPAIDLREPSGFEHVYRVPASAPYPWVYAGSAGAQRLEQLERRDGALRAVFDRSVYRNTRRGAVAEIPAGTVFRIGPEPRWPMLPTAPVRTEASMPASAPIATSALQSYGSSAKETVMRRASARPLPVSEPSRSENTPIDTTRQAAAIPAPTPIVLQTSSERTARLLQLATDQPTRRVNR